MCRISVHRSATPCIVPLDDPLSFLFRLLYFLVLKFPSVSSFYLLFLCLDVLFFLLSIPIPLLGSACSKLLVEAFLLCFFFKSLRDNSNISVILALTSINCLLSFGLRSF